MKNFIFCYGVYCNNFMMKWDYIELIILKLARSDTATHLGVYKTKKKNLHAFNPEKL